MQYAHICSRMCAFISIGLRHLTTGIPQLVHRHQLRMQTADFGLCQCPLAALGPSSWAPAATVLGCIQVI